MGPGSERLVDCAYCGCAAEGVVLIAQTDYLGGPGNAWDGGGGWGKQGNGGGGGGCRNLLPAPDALARPGFRV